MCNLLKNGELIHEHLEGENTVKFFLLNKEDMGNEIISQEKTGGIFWNSFLSVFGKNVLNDGDIKILTPLIYKRLVINEEGEIIEHSYIGKIIYLTPDSSTGKLNPLSLISDDMVESDKIMSLFIYLIKLEFTKVDFANKSLTSKELALYLSDKQIWIGERVRQKINAIKIALNKLKEEHGY